MSDQHIIYHFEPKISKPPEILAEDIWSTSTEKLKKIKVFSQIQLLSCLKAIGRRKTTNPIYDLVFEKIILPSPEYTYRLMDLIMHRKTHEIEKSISRSAKWSVMYAMNHLIGRFPLGEPAIKKDIYWSAVYQHYVLDKSDLDTINHP